VARTEAERKKAESLKKSSGVIHNVVQNKNFLTFLGFTILVTIVFIWLMTAVVNDGEVSSFDPFQILEIDRNADTKTIKKSYRKLSLLYHPDKNPGDRIAEAKFMMVSKAYEALTDETAKENWEKYGNPDGKQSLEVSIGLPKFLLDSSNRNLVLTIYLIFMVGIIPAAVWTYYSDSSKYGEKDVMYDSYAWYHHSLSEHTILKSLPEILAGSAEFRTRNMPKTAEEKSAIANVVTQLRAQMLKPKYNHPVCVKGNVLLHCHLLRKTTLLNTQLAQDLKYMLQYSTALIDAMISVCKHQDNFIGTASTIIEFGQYVTQALWTKDSELLQMPHFGPEEVKHLGVGKRPVKTIYEYRDLPDDQKKGMVHFTDAQKADVMAFLKLFPDITVTTKVFVDDDEDDTVYEGDLCTIQVNITRNNLEDGSKAGLVHAPLFPFPKQEAFWVILGQEKEGGKIISIDKIGNPNKTIVHKIKLMAPPVGTYEFDLLVKSNAYIGCDKKVKISLTTKDNSVLPEYKIHPDDAVLDDEPTLFEEILNAHIERDDSDSENEDEGDDEEDEDAQEEAKTKSAAAATTKDTSKRAALRKARQQNKDDDDDDSDSDAEEVYADK
jgi:translocation protein SEC63